MNQDVKLALRLRYKYVIERTCANRGLPFYIYRSDLRMNC